MFVELDWIDEYIRLKDKKREQGFVTGSNSWMGQIWTG